MQTVSYDEHTGAQWRRTRTRAIRSRASRAAPAAAIAVNITMPKADVGSVGVDRPAGTGLKRPAVALPVPVKGANSGACPGAAATCGRIPGSEGRPGSVNEPLCREGKFSPDSAAAAPAVVGAEPVATAAASTPTDVGDVAEGRPAAGADSGRVLTGAAGATRVGAAVL